MAEIRNAPSHHRFLHPAADVPEHVYDDGGEQAPCQLTMVARHQSQDPIGPGKKPGVAAAGGTAGDRIVSSCVPQISRRGSKPWTASPRIYELFI